MRTVLSALVLTIAAGLVGASFETADAKECTTTVKSGTKAVKVKCK